MKTQHEAVSDCSVGFRMAEVKRCHCGSLMEIFESEKSRILTKLHKCEKMEKALLQTKNKFWDHDVFSVSDKSEYYW